MRNLPVSAVTADTLAQVYVGLTEIFIKIWRAPANICINLISPETEHFAADGMGVALLVFTLLFSKSTQKITYLRKSRI